MEENKDYLVNELYQNKKTLYLTTSFNNIRDLIISNKTDEAERLLNKIVTDVPQLSNIKVIDLLNDTSRYDEYIDKCNNHNKYYIKTGFIELDKILLGGWNRQEELTTIVGRPGIGKSFILFKCALAAAEQGLNVGLYEGEMSLNSVGYRIDTLISHISNGQLLYGNSNIINEYKDHLKNIKNKVKGTLKILTPNMLGGPAGVSALRSFIERENLDILFLDQHSLLEDDRGAKNPVEKAANISKDLKNLQVMKKIPIISASQQNREKEDNGVSLRQISQADRIGQDSTIVIFLDQKEGVLTMTLVKSRYVGSGKILNYKVDYDRGSYVNIPVEEKNKDNNTNNNEELEELKSSYDLTPTINDNSNPF